MAASIEQHISAPCHLQRLVRECNARYGLNASNAALLFSCPQIPVGEVASEVGSASPHALARAFAQVGFSGPRLTLVRVSARGMSDNATLLGRPDVFILTR